MKKDVALQITNLIEKNAKQIQESKEPVLFVTICDDKTLGVAVMGDGLHIVAMMATLAQNDPNLARIIQEGLQRGFSEPEKQSFQKPKAQA
jgi:uncharacterized protein YjfI (DUF2170 family)